MSAVIYPSVLSGSLAAPGSKSFMQRLLLCAALSHDECELVCSNLCNDVMRMVGCLRAIGADIEIIGDSVRVKPIENTGFSVPSLDCGESGAVLRFLLPVLCALGIKTELHLGKRLAERPISELVNELNRCGAAVERPAPDVLVTGGRLRVNEFNISAAVSSQFVSGLLFALASMGGGAVNITSEVASAPYIDMTILCLLKSGVSVHRSGSRIDVSGTPKLSGRTVCEGDWSGAAFWLCAAAIGKAPITVTGLDTGSPQGDRRVCDILRAAGAGVSVCGGSVSVSPAPLHPLELNCSDIPDLVPALSLVCACADGVSRLSGIGRLRTKESDRADSVCQLIRSLGGSAEISGDTLLIRGGGLTGGCVRSYSDHRIIMSAAAAASACREPVVLDGFSGFNKSYLRFDRDFLALGGRYELV